MKQSKTRRKHAPILLPPPALDRLWVELSRGRTPSRAVLALIASTGCRLQEALDIHWSAWSPHGEIAIGTLKRGDNLPRIRLLNQHARLIISRLYEHTHPQGGPPDHTPMFARNGTPHAISQRAVRGTCARVGRSIGHPGLNPTDLRRTYITYLCDAIGPRATQEIVGHRHIGSTMRYVQPTATDRARAADVLVNRKPDPELPF